MTERRKIRVSDWFNGAIGMVTLMFAGWAGVKLTEVGEDVSAIKAQQTARTSVIRSIEVDVDKIEDKVDHINLRLTNVEAIIKK